MTPTVEQIERTMRERQKPREPKPGPVVIVGACLICGSTELAPRSAYHSQGNGIRIAAASLGLWRGYVEGPLCRQCMTVEREAGDPTSIRYSNRPLWAVVTERRLEAERPGWTNEPIRLRHLPLLTFAGLVVSGRAEQNEPAPPAKPFGWLRRKWANMDFPEPPPAPRPAPDTTIPGCLICGDVTKTSRPLRQFPGPWFGLAGSIRGRFCSPCDSAYTGFQSQAVTFTEDPHLPATVAVTVTHRIRATRPDVLTELGADVIALVSLDAFCWAGRVTAARDTSQPDPKPGDAFWWL